VPVPETQVKVLDAELAAAPTVAEMAVMADGVYPRVNWSPAGELPEDVKVRLRAAVPFDAAVAEDRTKEPDCPNKQEGIATTNRAINPRKRKLLRAWFGVE